MTAPEVNADVRARFEAWLLDREIKTPRRPNGYYQSDETCFWWRLWQDAYRAAHADLAGVRELVDRVEDQRLTLVNAIKRAGGDPLKWSDWAPEERAAINAAMDVDNAALAKFHPTHQEKP